jgi:hypothetical protein
VAQDDSAGKERPSLGAVVDGVVDDAQLWAWDQSVEGEEEVPVLAPPVHVAVGGAVVAVVADAATAVKAILPSKPATRTTVIKDRSSQRGGLMGFNSVEVFLCFGWLFIRSPHVLCIHYRTQRTVRLPYASTQYYAQRIIPLPN